MIRQLLTAPSGSGMKPEEEPAPTAEEVRETLRQILASPAFVHAPQLGAFLRFVVESVLAGEGAYIKSYTVAVAALGRRDSFDPKIDPIVRVEAGRLRRALARYYADANTADTVVIGLPLGSYVPTFCRARPRSRRSSLVAGLYRRLAGPSGAWTGFAAIVLLIAAGCGLLITMGLWRIDGMDITGAIRPVATLGQPTESTVGPILPLVFVQSFETIGASAHQAIEIEALRRKLRDALARFDEIEVASEAAPSSPRQEARSTYRLTGTAEYRGDDALNLSLRLADADEGTVAWSQVFEVNAAAATALDGIVQQVATQLAQPYGVIYARELADSRTDPRYRCLIGAFEYRRGFDRATSLDVVPCLEQLTGSNPKFADGFAMLALLALRQYYEWETGRVAALERAMTLAQHAVNLKPQSARARQALLSALFARGEIAAALAEGKTAVTANPYDMVVLHAYGMRLVLSGRIEEGVPLVRQAVALTPVRPASFEFALFLCAYLLGDDEKASDQARLFTNNDYPLLLVVRAVAAARAGDAEQARRAVDRLTTVHPAWRVNARQRLERYFASSELVDRLMGDLATAGFVPTQ
jgi:tetratricopeptide (TPR) repeat protein